jgi:hypothetical protein
MSSWDWFHEFERTALEKHDRERLRLCQAYHQGYQLREKDPDQAFGIFSEARQLAHQLGESWMALFYDEWRATALLHFKRDYRNVLDLAVQAALEVRKPQYATFPGRFGIFDNLVAAYLGIDPGGYADAVQQAMDYLDKELPQEPDSHRYLLLARRRIFCLEQNRYDEALDWSLKEMALADSDRDRSRAEHFQVFVYCALCQIAAARGEWDNLDEWSQTGDTITRRVGHQVELSELIAWRAVVARKRGEEEKAMRLARSAASRQKAQRMPPGRGFYEALCLYHDLSGDLPSVLAVRDRELKDVSGWGRFLTEARCRVNRCKLLARMGQPLDAELEAAREAVAKLREPAPMLSELEQIV